MRGASLILAGGLLALTGCGKKAPASGPSGTHEQTNNVAPAPVAVPPTATAPADTSESDTAAVLARLTRAVRRYGLEQRRAPRTLDEVVAAGYLGAVPIAPAGKRFAINENLEVYLTK